MCPYVRSGQQLTWLWLWLLECASPEHTVLMELDGT